MLVATDTFAGRTVSNGWGTTSDGLFSWTRQSGTVANLSVSGGKGQYIYDAAATGCRMQLGSSNYGDVHLLARFNRVATGAGFGLIMHYADGSNHNYIRVSANQPQLVSRVAGVDSPSNMGAAIASITVGVDYWIRCQCIGTTYYVKAWKDGDAEPGSWTTTTNATNTAAGKVGVYMSLSAGTTGLVDTLTFYRLDTLSVPARAAYALRLARSQVEQVTFKLATVVSRASRTTFKLASVLLHRHRAKFAIRLPVARSNQSRFVSRLAVLRTSRSRFATSLSMRQQPRARFSERLPVQTKHRVKFVLRLDPVISAHAKFIIRLIPRVYRVAFAPAVTKMRVIFDRKW